jgi:hypothetical protein
MKRLILPALAALLFSTAAMAQPMRIRGTIAAITPTSMTVTSRDGATLDIALAAPLSVSTVKPVALADIKPGSYIGTAARPGANGALVAQEVLVFPEAMRGAGEGHRPWDLTPESTMTNAAVEGTVVTGDGTELTLAYKGGSQKVVVPPGTPIVTIAPASVADLKVGAPVFIGATLNAAGKLSASRVTVGTNGVAPPM